MESRSASPIRHSSRSGCRAGRVNSAAGGAAHVVEAASARETADGGAVQPRCPADRGQEPSLSQQRLDCLTSSRLGATRRRGWPMNGEGAVRRDERHGHRTKRLRRDQAPRGCLRHDRGSPRTRPGCTRSVSRPLSLASATFRHRCQASAICTVCRAPFRTLPHRRPSLALRHQRVPDGAELRDRRHSPSSGPGRWLRGGATVGNIGVALVGPLVACREVAEAVVVCAGWVTLAAWVPPREASGRAASPTHRGEPAPGSGRDDAVPA